MGSNPRWRPNIPQGKRQATPKSPNPDQKGHNMLELLIFSALVFGTIGAFVGSTKGSTKEGLILGALLGIIGLIILAFMPGKEEKIRRMGLHSDPFGRHQLRRFYNGEWTDDVYDNGIRSKDAALPTPTATRPLAVTK